MRKLKNNKSGFALVSNRKGINFRYEVGALLAAPGLIRKLFLIAYLATG